MGKTLWERLQYEFIKRTARHMKWVVVCYMGLCLLKINFGENEWSSQ